LIARPSTTDNVFVGFDQSLSEFAIGFTDSHAGLSEIAIKDGQDFTLNVHGNVEASYYFGDGTQLIGVALETELDNVESDVIDLTSNLSSNVERIGVLETKTTDISYTDGTTRISGNLTVLGNTTTLDTVNLIVQDPILQLSNASALPI